MANSRPCSRPVPTDAAPIEPRFTRRGFASLLEILFAEDELPRPDQLVPPSTDRHSTDRPFLAETST